MMFVNTALVPYIIFAFSDLISEDDAGKIFFLIFNIKRKQTFYKKYTDFKGLHLQDYIINNIFYIFLSIVFLTNMSLILDPRYFWMKY
jgi:hypothetical protein